MPVNFTFDRWQTIKDNARKWWAGELERPLIQVTLADPDVANRLKGRRHEFTSFYGLDTPIETIVDHWEEGLQGTQYLGDGFPHVMPNFGPGVAAAFLGADLHNSIDAGTSWFHPRQARTANELAFRHDTTAPWWPRVCEIYRAARKRFGGLVQIDMTDLGGNLDILSTFRPSENLLLDLYDCPDEVHRLTWEAHDRWWDYYTRLSALCGPDNPGYTAWTPIFSERPYYMLQCDFCYMISPDMFDKFVRPELQASCQRLVNPFFHLDGPGQLPHLDSLLSIPELKGIQWIPGAGAPDVTHWPDLYRKIHKAGKLIQVFRWQTASGWDLLDRLVDQIGSAKGIVFIAEVDKRETDQAMKLLDKYGAT